MDFVKMHGAGNDFIILEDLNNLYLGKENELAKKLCDRHFGIGADGLVFIRNTQMADIEMVIINSDGSYASMCGNAIRCFAKYVYDNKIVTKQEIRILTGDGVKIAYLEVDNEIVSKVKIYMGKPSFLAKDIPSTLEDNIVDRVINIKNKKFNITSMLMGVPHTIVMSKLDDIDVVEGASIEKCEYFPQGTNVNFCEVINDKKVLVKTWERGAGATLACGTGCCSAVVATNKLGLTGGNVEVIAPGGILYIDVTKDGVYMSGDATFVFKGTLI